MLKEIKFALCNEKAGPNLEELIGISWGLAVGAGLFKLGDSMYDWLVGAGSSISQISTTVPS